MREGERAKSRAGKRRGAEAQGGKAKGLRRTKGELQRRRGDEAELGSGTAEHGSERGRLRRKAKAERRKER